MLRLCVSFPTGGVDEGVPRDGAVFAVMAEVEQSTLPVAVVKLIADVPAQRTKLLPLLKHMQNKIYKKMEIQTASTTVKHVSVHKAVIIKYR